MTLIKLLCKYNAKVDKLKIIFFVFFCIIAFPF